MLLGLLLACQSNAGAVDGKKRSLYHKKFQNKYYIDYSEKNEEFRLRQDAVNTTNPDQSTNSTTQNTTQDDSSSVDTGNNNNSSSFKVVSVIPSGSIDLGYSGKYNSAPKDEIVWEMNYDFVIHATFTGALEFVIADFYSFKIETVLDLFEISLLKQYLKFIHPHTMLHLKIKNGTAPEFNLGLMSDFEVRKLFNFKITLSDKMKANFEKELDGLFTEAIKFGLAATFGEEDYVPPEDDTLNIANGMNYLPSSFDYGEQVWTNSAEDL